VARNKPTTRKTADHLTDGKSVNYQFDTAGNLLSRSGARTSRYQTFTQGPVSATYTYATNSSLIAGITLANNGNTLMTTAKNYDQLNRLQSIVQSVRATYADGSYWVYGYDDLGQVISGNRHWSDGLPVEGQQFGYTFDGIGNRVGTTTSGRPLVSYSCNALNQYTSRDVPGTLDVIGSAAPTATVTVNGTPTKRHGAYFAGTVTADNSTAPVNQPVTITGVKPRGEKGVRRHLVTREKGGQHIVTAKRLALHSYSEAAKRRP